jgi:hypothetical protein
MFSIVRQSVAQRFQVSVTKVNVFPQGQRYKKAQICEYNSRIRWWILIEQILSMVRWVDFHKMKVQVTRGQGSIKNIKIYLYQSCLCFEVLWSEDALSLTKSLLSACVCLRASRLFHAITPSWIRNFINNMNFTGTNVHHEISCYEHEPSHRVRGQGHLRWFIVKIFAHISPSPWSEAYMFSFELRQAEICLPWKPKGMIRIKPKNKF